MTNDKLTDVIKNEINAEANEYSEIILNGRLLHVDDKLKGYIAGATAWAPWKVRFDELKARCDKMAQLLYMLQSVHSHEWSDGNQENVKQTLQQWQQFKDRKEVGDGIH